MTSSPTTISHWRETKLTQAKKAIDEMFAESGIDEEEMLARLQALRAYIEELMGAIR